MCSKTSARSFPDRTSVVFTGKSIRIWSFLSIIAASAGAFMLYPIGTAVLNVLFVLIKISMVSGLLIMLIRHHCSGLYLWCGASLAAIVMTICKCSLSGEVSALYILAIITDLLMPTVACLLLKQAKN